MSLSNTWRILKNTFGRGVMPHELSVILDLPGRGLILSAKTVASRLPVAPDADVLEVGPGSGYYSLEAARCVPQGTLALVDLQDEMLQKCRRKLEAAGVSNFTTHTTDAATLPFDDDRFDAIFMVTVFGEIDDRETFLAEAYRVLRPGGVLSINEHHPDPDFEAYPAVAREVEAHGFVAGERMGWRWAWTMNAVKPSHA